MSVKLNEARTKFEFLDNPCVGVILPPMSPPIKPPEWSNKKFMLSGAQLDTLVALVERGPLESGDVPSKRGRDELITIGLAVQVIANGEDGYTAATYAGRDEYKAQFGGGSIQDAKAKRIAARG